MEIPSFPEDVSAATPQILIVDDDAAQCRVLEKLLTDHGYSARSTTDSATALESLACEHYDVLVLDYLMPEMNGVEVFRLARNVQPHVAGVFLTAHTTIDVVFPAIDAGAERVLSKPVDTRELLPVIQELLAAQRTDHKNKGPARRA
jgi:CheY-like chemotaxis protein